MKLTRTNYITWQRIIKRNRYGRHFGATFLKTEHHHWAVAMVKTQRSDRNETTSARSLSTLSTLRHSIA